MKKINEITIKINNDTPDELTEAQLKELTDFLYLATQTWLNTNIIGKKL